MNNPSLKEAFPQIIEIARFAPSVHNTQPWQVTQNEDSIIVILDRAHALSDGDPTGRQTTISLGIFTEAVIIAAEQYGFTAEKVTLEDTTVTITCAPAKKPAASAEKMTQLLRTRSSDRSLYHPITIPEEAVQRITQSSKSFPVSVTVTQDTQSIEKIAHFTSKGIGLALSNPNFRRELSHYLVPPWSSKKRGISVKSLYINPVVASLQPLMMRLGLGVHKEVSLEKQRWMSASAVIVITASGDLAQFWLATGRAYLRISLAIEELGYSQATSAAIVEASDYHEDVEELLKTNQRILSVIRIGSGSSRRQYSPRLAVSDITT